ncbi:TPA: hypothetical protein N0F65_002591 [Lagenidium giganteum]|uniref:ApaG domain-containing protein n=1 Tax=Lagenidium giganteum TaxID=4803 RepID=A0AAV2YX04_9STRA|nr:TPA: hypothetical protein N0F65_002591 [Lagenidium giganteum]
MTKPSTIRAIYKCLLFEAQQLSRVPHFRLRNRLQLEQWGTGAFVEHRSMPTPDATRLCSLQQFHALQKQGFRYEDRRVDVVDMVRQGFRTNLHLDDPKAISLKLDEAIECLQELSEQLLLARCSSVTNTNGIRIEATSQYVPSHSRPDQRVYRFTYRITVTNTNDTNAVQITGRQYTFSSVSGQRISLPRNSPGIVGQVPILLPGQTYEYGSGVDIDSPEGNVVGCLHVVQKSKEQGAEDVTFDAFVSRFELHAPPSAR